MSLGPINTVLDKNVWVEVKVLLCRVNTQVTLCVALMSSLLSCLKEEAILLLRRLSPQSSDFLMGVWQRQKPLHILFPLLVEFNPVKRLTGQIKNQCGLHWKKEAVAQGIHNNRTMQGSFEDKEVGFWRKPRPERKVNCYRGGVRNLLGVQTP